MNRAEPNLTFEIAETEFLGAFEFLAKLAEFLDTVGAAGGAASRHDLAAGAGGGGGGDGGGLNVTVDESGITAGFTLEIPSIVVGVLSIENIVFRLYVVLPFIGDPLSVEVGFSSSESPPFAVTVMGLGGGGYVKFVLTPEGVTLAASTVTPGRTPPEASLTTPVRVARPAADWA